MKGLAVAVVAFACLGQADAATPPTSTISAEVGFLLNSLIADSISRPDVNAVDTYAAAFHWVKNPPEMNALLNSKVGYHGRINGHKVVLGGDGTNDIFAVAISQGFEATEVLATIRQAFTVRFADREDSAGQRNDTYYLLDHGKSVGILMLMYGVADAIQGSGTAAFMSMKKAHEAAGR
jgi:hypothetical protein